MMRLCLSTMITTAVLLAASAAFGVTYVTDISEATLNPGETVTILFTATNPQNLAINSVGSAAYDYDKAVVNFVTGNASETFFNTSYCEVCMIASGGLDNDSDPAGDGVLVEIASRVNLLQGASPDAIVGGSEQNDIGWDGVLVRDGGAHARVIFEAVAPGVTTIVFGTDGLGDIVEGPDGLIETVNASVTITVIPEPGTVVLMGIGLVSLTLAGRRSAEPVIVGS